MKKIFTCAFVITVLCLNATFNKGEEAGSTSDSDKYFINNIECLQSSATEYACVGNSGICSTPDGSKSLGKLVRY